MLRHHGGASTTRQIGRDSSASWRGLDGPGFFHLTFLHSTNLHGMLTLVCFGQSYPTRTTCSDTTSQIKDLQVTICARGLIALPYLLKTPGTLFLEPFMEPCSTAIKTVYQLNYICQRSSLVFLFVWTYIL